MLKPICNGLVVAANSVHDNAGILKSNVTAQSADINTTHDIPLWTALWHRREFARQRGRTHTSLLAGRTYTSPLAGRTYTSPVAGRTDTSPMAERIHTSSVAARTYTSPAASVSFHRSHSADYFLIIILNPSVQASCCQHSTLWWLSLDLRLSQTTVTVAPFKRNCCCLTVASDIDHHHIKSKVDH
ncbi:hypothetical protein BsWGS_17525 [Bradybaena similaris]